MKSFASWAVKSGFLDETCSNHKNLTTIPKHSAERDLIRECFHKKIGNINLRF